MTFPQVQDLTITTLGILALIFIARKRERERWEGSTECKHQRGSHRHPTSVENRRRGPTAEAPDLTTAGAPGLATEGAPSLATAGAPGLATAGAASLATICNTRHIPATSSVIHTTS